MDNNITIQNTISIGIEIPPETFINEKTINVQNLIIESSSTNNGTICIPDNVSNNIVVPMNITVRQSRQSGVAGATCPD